VSVAGSSPPAGALTGVRVLEFGQYLAGPLAGMLLADQGAEVIRVEPPGGPRWDTPANAVWNRGKRSVTLDLQRNADRDFAQALVAGADVLVEGFRPGVMDRLGLGAATLMAAHPGLIYVSIPGFASDDPRAAVAGWDGVVAAAASAHGGRPDRSEPTGMRPVFSALAIPSSYGAFLSVVSIAMALIARRRDGVGQRIEVPLFDATFNALGFRVLRVHDAGSATVPNPAARPPRAMAAAMGIHRCADGRWIFFHMGNGDALGFLEQLGIGADALAAPDAAARVKALFATKTAAAWEALGAAARTELVEIRSSAEWLTEPHARRSGLVTEVEDPVYGTMLQPGLQATLSATPGRIRHGAPRPGADTEALRAAPTARPAPVGSRTTDPAASRSVLAGIRVLDLCIVLAGPTCGRTLAEFGADVIRIDRPSTGRAGLGGRGDTFNLDVNRAKRSIIIDLKQPRGMAVFWRLAERADVVVQNFREGVADRLGFGYEAVAARKPDIVYASLNAFGYAGPWRDRPGHEQLAQSATGMAVRYGGDGPPLLQHVGAINDYGTGLLGAYAVALALLHRQETGQGQHVTTALAATAGTLQSAFLFDYPAKRWDEPAGQDVLGSGPLQRLYRASDGWLFLGAPGDDGGVLAAIEGLSGAAGLRGAALESFLEAAIAAQAVEVWMRQANVGRVGVHRLTPLRDVVGDPWVREHGLVITRPHEGLGPVDTNGVTVRLSRTPAVPGNPAPSPGRDTRAIAGELGLADELESLLADGVIAERQGTR
jgi:crotonobetainyl-CoA:carnitine CoA-transferase CaiB-like acyl-CoA transferase